MSERYTEKADQALRLLIKAPGLPPQGHEMLNVNFYREYETEALRIFVPALGADDEVQMSSFMAALQLGLKEHFRGQVDHLAMEVQSLPDRENGVRNRYVILYDGVPGGTGYLKQFVSDKDRQTLLFKVLDCG